MSTKQSTIEGAYKARSSTQILRPSHDAGESRFVNVGGEVKTPQRVPFTADLTVLSSISGPGGFSPYADQRKVRLLRGNQVTIVDIKKVRTNPSCLTGTLSGRPAAGPAHSIADGIGRI
jgi:polysaccharide export outer membrane protein